MKMSDPKIRTDHHTYLVALTFDEKDDPERVIAKINKSDVDELRFEIGKITYYFSLDQFIQLMKNMFKEELKK